ncbi:MAG: hemin uptake protein HemP [Planctomycetaceae bacterium]
MTGTTRRESTSPLDDEPEGEPTSPAAPVLRSEELLRGEKEVLIEHQGSLYRLRQTRNGKLILHK